MKMLEIIVLFLLFVILGFGIYVLWLNLPGESVEIGGYSANFSGTMRSAQSVQFYPEMRYRDRTIRYSIELECSNKKRNEILEAFEILSERTILLFRLADSQNSEIKILCSEIAPEPEERGHFVAGEGGPSEVINTTLYSVILSGKVSLFRADRCDKPQVALHEILHALGFDHNSNQKSVMYPTTDCDQELDAQIVDEINRLYKVESAPDLAIEKISANKSGRYLSFEIVVMNAGLKNSATSELIVFTDEKEIKKFSLGKIEIGTKRILNVQNIRVPVSFNEVRFLVESPDAEISDENNLVVIDVAAS